MNGFLLYIVRSGLYLGLFYAFYILVMRRTTFFRFNRAALLAGSLSCVLLPLLRVRTAPVMMVAAGPLTMTDISVQADGTAAADVSWQCSACGQLNLGPFCSECGSVKPKE